MGVTGNVGTTGYQAPEVVSGKVYGGTAYVFSLGKTLEKLSTRIRGDSTEDVDLSNEINAMLAQDPATRCNVHAALALPIF